MPKTPQLYLQGWNIKARISDTNLSHFCWFLSSLLLLKACGFSIVKKIHKRNEIKSENSDCFQKYSSGRLDRT